MLTKKIYKKSKAYLKHAITETLSTHQFILGIQGPTGFVGPIGPTGYPGSPSDEGPFDEELARFVIWAALHQGDTLKIRRTWTNKSALMGNHLIQGYQNGMFLEKLIEPIVKELEKKVKETPGMEDFMKHGHLPGVTKIRIRKTWSILRYTTEHKMGKQGGRNFHLTGEFKLKSK